MKNKLKKFYSALLIFVAICVLNNVASAQILIKPNNSYGTIFNRIRTDSLQGLPKDTFAVTGSLITYPWLADRNDSLFYWSTKNFRWTLFQGGGGSGSWGTIAGNILNQSDLIAKFNAKQDSLPTGSTTQYYRGNKSLGNLQTDVLGFTDLTYSKLGHQHVSADITDFTGNVRGSITVTGTGCTYNSATGVINCSSSGGSGVYGHVQSPITANGDTLKLTSVPSTIITGAKDHTYILDFLSFMWGNLHGTSPILYNSSNGTFSLDSTTNKSVTLTKTKFIADSIANVYANQLQGLYAQSPLLKVNDSTITEQVGTDAQNGYMAAADHVKLTTVYGYGNPATQYVPLGRTITINGTTLDLSANRSYTVSAGSATFFGLTDVNAPTPHNGEVPYYDSASLKIKLQKAFKLDTTGFQNGDYIKWSSAAGNFVRTNSAGGDVYLANNQTLTGINTFSNTFNLTGTTFLSDFTKIRALIQDTTNGKTYRTNVFGFDATGLTDGDGVKWSAAANKFIRSAPTAGVSSFNSRTGAVVPAANDYTFAQLASKPTTLSGYGITDATSNARAAFSITNIGTSGNATYDNTTGIWNIPNYTLSAPSQPLNQFVYGTGSGLTSSSTIRTDGNFYIVSNNNPANGFQATNTAANGYSRTALNNSTGVGAYMTIYGSTFGTTTVRNIASFGGTAKAQLYSDDANASGGTDPVILSAGGYAANQFTFNPNGTIQFTGALNDGTSVAKMLVVNNGLTSLQAITAGGGAVNTVFGRTGDVVAAANDYTFAQIGSKPTTLAGYGITDGLVSFKGRTGAITPQTGDYTFAQIGVLPTTLSGYGITDATSTARAAISLTTIGSGAASYNNTTGVLNVPTSTTTSSGSYTPTISGQSNISTSQLYTCYWTRVGNIVTVTGQVDINPTTANVVSSFLLSIPVANSGNFTARNLLNGVINQEAYYDAGVVYASTADVNASFSIKSNTTGIKDWHFTFTYQVF